MRLFGSHVLSQECLSVALSELATVTPVASEIATLVVVVVIIFIALELLPVRLLQF